MSDNPIHDDDAEEWGCACGHSSVEHYEPPLGCMASFERNVFCGCDHYIAVRSTA